MKVQTIAQSKSEAAVIPMLQRFLLIALIVSVQMMYFPTSEQLTGGIEPKLPIDVFPILPAWVLPYLLCYPLWILGIVWAVLKMQDDMFRSFVAASLLTCTFAISIFIFFPTYVPEAVIPGDGVFTGLLRSIHQEWGRYNALPSGHIYITALLALFYSQWYPRRKGVWITVTIIVSLSTLFTAQHYVADIFAGLLVAYLGYSLGRLWAGISTLALPQIRSSITRTNDFS